MGVTGVRTCIQMISGLMSVPTVTVTDETGYHIYSDLETAPVGSFQRGGLKTTGVRIGDMACKRTASGGWVWTDAT